MGAGGCGGSGSSPCGTDHTSTSRPVELAPDGLRAVTVYFANPDGRRLIPVTRYVPPDSGVARGALLGLLAGPSAEDPAGLSSAAPADTRLLGIVIRDSVATVDLSRAFESGAGSAAVRMRLAQLTYTLTRLSAVRVVRLWLEGRPSSVFSAEGLEISGGLRRSDFHDLAPFDDDPPVVLTQPVPGSTVRGPLIVRGTANVRSTMGRAPAGGSAGGDLDHAHAARDAAAPSRKRSLPVPRVETRGGSTRASAKDARILSSQAAIHRAPLAVEVRRATSERGSRARPRGRRDHARWSAVGRETADQSGCCASTFSATANSTCASLLLIRPSWFKSSIRWSPLASTKMSAASPYW